MCDVSGCTQMSESEFDRSVEHVRTILATGNFGLDPECVAFPEPWGTRFAGLTWIESISTDAMCAWHSGEFFPPSELWTYFDTRHAHCIIQALAIVQKTLDGPETVMEAVSERRLRNGLSRISILLAQLTRGVSHREEFGEWIVTLLLSTMAVRQYLLYELSPLEGMRKPTFLMHSSCIRERVLRDAIDELGRNPLDLAQGRSLSSYLDGLV